MRAQDVASIDYSEEREGVRAYRGDIDWRGAPRGYATVNDALHRSPLDAR